MDIHRLGFQNLTKSVKSERSRYNLRRQSRQNIHTFDTTFKNFHLFVHNKTTPHRNVPIKSVAWSVTSGFQPMSRCDENDDGLDANIDTLVFEWDRYELTVHRYRYWTLSREQSSENTTGKFLFAPTISCAIKTRDLEGGELIKREPWKISTRE